MRYRQDTGELQQAGDPKNTLHGRATAIRLLSHKAMRALQAAGRENVDLFLL